MTTDAEGGCTCSAVRYRLLDSPLFVHCCHCTWCQRETGASFALNAMIEADRVQLVCGELETIDTPSNSGKGQQVVRCRQCKVAVWSHYAGARDRISFLRVGTLDDPSQCPPSAHIFTSTKQPWIELPNDVPVFEAFYRRSEYWSAENVARYKAAIGAN